MQAKISDFGLAKEQPSIPDGKSYVKVESMRGSRGYERMNTMMDNWAPNWMYSVLEL